MPVRCVLTRVHKCTLRGVIAMPAEVQSTEKSLACSSLYVA
jgi:hypothetical protein